MESIIGTRPHESVAEVFKEVSPRLWRAVLAYAGDRDVASDAVAEAFAQVLRRGSAVRDVRRWVWAAAFRIAAGELKARSRMVPLMESAVEGPDVDGILLLSALRQLSPAQRGSLILRYYAGYSASEIAPILGSTTGAVRVHLARGRRKLRHMLQTGEAR